MRKIGYVQPGRNVGFSSLRFMGFEPGPLRTILRGPGSMRRNGSRASSSVKSERITSFT